MYDRLLYPLHLALFVASMSNIRNNWPESLVEESFQDLLSTRTVRIERIISQGHTSPESGWYDQQENEWVLVIEGKGKLLFEDGREITLGPGDYRMIAAHEKHRVSWTEPAQPTLWLAVFYP